MKDNGHVSASEWLDQGLKYMRAGAYQDALKVLDIALQLDSSLAKAWCNRGAALLELHQYDQSLNSYERAFSLECRNCALGWCSKGRAFQALGRHLEAIFCFNEAIKRKPEYWEALQNRGFCLLLLDRFDEALKDCNQAIQLQSDQADLYLNRGIALHGLKNYESALKNYEKALSLNREHPKIWYNQGCTLTRLNRYKEASVSHREAIRLRQGKYWQAWQALGWTAIYLEGYKAAHKIWSQGIQKLLTSHDDHDHLLGCAELYFTKGESYYLEAKQQSNAFPYWRSAQQWYGRSLAYFEQGLKRESSNLYLRERYLATLQEYINVRRCTGISNEKLEKLLRDGSDRLQVLLKDQGLSETKKTTLAFKYLTFDRLTVGCLAKEKQIKRAFEVAEQDKNACLTWLFSGWVHKDEVLSPNFNQIQALLKPATAIVYWHYSPVGITTFVLKFGESIPNLIFQESKNNSSTAHNRLCLERWIFDWNQQYSDYRDQGKTEGNRNPDHPWRDQMPDRLDTLKQILDIDSISPHLSDIKRLILIPHQDLHRFPLHIFFDLPDCTITYLPSAQLGLNLQRHASRSLQSLLSIENPKSGRFSSMGFARVEAQSIAQEFKQVFSLREQDATLEQFVQALQSRSYNVVHFAGHAAHHLERPMQSELVLAGKEGLKLETIGNLDLSHLDLVSLSACETAITGNQAVTIEYVGLVSGFLRQGVSQVVSTLWVVESVVSALVMIEFYRRRINQSNAVALKQAITWLRQLTLSGFKQWQAELLSSLPPELPNELRSRIQRSFKHQMIGWDMIEPDQKLFDHPYYWAAFILSGKVD